MTNNFKKNEVICFVGDSITSDGRWIAEVYETLKKDEIRMFNCGIAGTTTEDALSRIYNDCLNFAPNYVVIMFGLNDIGLDLYAKQSPEAEEKKLANLIKYEKNITSLIEICQKTSKVILMTPTPYDDITDEHTNNFMANEGVTKASQIIKELATKYQLTLVDTNKSMNYYLSTEIIGPDRIHPNAKGHHIIAQTFMHETEIINEFDLENTFAISPQNKKRIKSTEIYRNMQFVEYYILKPMLENKKVTIQEKKEMLTQMLRKSTPFTKKMLDEYIKNIDFKDDVISEMVKSTLFE